MCCIGISVIVISEKAYHLVSSVLVSSCFKATGGQSHENLAPLSSGQRFIPQNGAAPASNSCSQMGLHMFNGALKCKMILSTSRFKTTVRIFTQTCRPRESYIQPFWPTNHGSALSYLFFHFLHRPNNTYSSA